MTLPFFPQPKPAPRLKVKEEKRRAAKSAWEECCRIVDARDGQKCRCCKRRVVRTIELVGNRAERHHIERRRKETELLTDPRNLLVVCLECHGKLTRHELRIVQQAADRFTLNGKAFINADKPVRFIA